MKIRLSCMTFGLCGLLLSGCYTVIQGPRTAADVENKDLVAVEEKGTSPLMGDFDQRDDDYYRYPGAPGGYGGYGNYGGYGGYPAYGAGYRSGSGYYGYGSYPYYGSGYGPSYYGYDPYYQDSGGFYIPAGYELVTGRELEELRASRRALAELNDQIDPGEEEQRQLEQQRKEEETWMRRVEPQVRSTPVATPRPTTVSSPSSSPPAPRATTSSSSSSSTKSTKKPSAKPKKTRR